VLAIIAAVWLYRARHSFRTSSVLLGIACRVIESYNATSLIQLLCISVYMLYVWCWGYTLAALAHRDVSHTVQWDGNTSGTKVMVVLLVICLVWTGEVISNIAFCCTCSATGAWYYPAHTTPENPTLQGLIRTLTTNFSGVCLGSLLPSFIFHCSMAVKYLYLALPEGSVPKRSVGRIVKEIDARVTPTANPFSYVHLTYNCTGYRSASHSGWTLVKSTGVLAILHESILHSVLLWNRILCCLWISAACALGSGDVSLVPLTLLVSLCSPHITDVFNAAAIASLVSFADSPESMRESNPDLYKRFHCAMAVADT